ncbi:MAG: Spy/CpxP family protein refolding chaperone [Gammaproteobacteria bacterium]|nr:Spy/CpxP family protein refolding chaperone [Gammaproteobacteria bacterium]
MKKATKVLVTTVAVVGITAASFSLVAARGGWSGCDGPYGMGRAGEYGEMSRGFGGERGMHKRGFGMDPAARLERMESRMAERIDYMKYKLKITAEQEPAWTALTESLKQKMANKAEHFAAMRDGGFTIQDKVKLMREGSADLKSLADGIDNLYAQLTPEQQKIADGLGPMFGRRGR